MNQMLMFALWVLFAIGMGWLVFWGSGRMGMDATLRAILAAIVFILLLVFALARAGMLPL